MAVHPSLLTVPKTTWSEWTLFPLAFIQIFPLSFFLGWSMLYCTYIAHLVYTVLFYNDHLLIYSILHCYCSTILVFSYCALFWFWKCVPGILIPKTQMRNFTCHHRVFSDQETSYITRLAYFGLRIGCREGLLPPWRFLRKQFLWLGSRRVRHVPYYPSSMSKIEKKIEYSPHPPVVSTWILVYHCLCGREARGFHMRTASRFRNPWVRNTIPRILL